MSGFGRAVFVFSFASYIVYRRGWLCSRLVGGAAKGLRGISGIERVFRAARSLMWLLDGVRNTVTAVPGPGARERSES